MIATVTERQSTFDLAIQHLGSVEGCFFVAEKLGVSITDKLQIGRQFEYAESDIIDRSIAYFYSNNKLTPSTDNE